MINYILFGMITLSFVFVFLSAVFFYREKDLEDMRLRGGVNCLFAGLIFFALFLLYKSASYGLIILDKKAIPYGYIIEVVTVTLMILLFLVGMIVFREI